MIVGFVLGSFGFVLGSYSIVGNDAIQTLGTFLSSNSHRPWWVLWLFAGSIITVVLVYGWMVHSGDVSYGRLEAIPVPNHFSWVYCVPPFVLLLLTRWGVPVSTPFLTLTIFAPKALSSMLLKSLLGYATAFVVAIIVYKLVTRSLEARFNRTEGPTSPLVGCGPVVLDWFSLEPVADTGLGQYLRFPTARPGQSDARPSCWMVHSQHRRYTGLARLHLLQPRRCYPEGSADEDEHHRHPLGDVCGLDLRDRAVCVQGAQPHPDEYDLGFRRFAGWTRDRHSLGTRSTAAVRRCPGLVLSDLAKILAGLLVSVALRPTVA